MITTEFRSTSSAPRCLTLLLRIASGSGDSAHFGRQKATIPAFWKYVSRFRL